MSIREMDILQINDLAVWFGGIRALDHLDLSVKEGEIRSIIGPNGAGKTTLFNTLTGLYHPGLGEILFCSANITGWPPYKIAAEGITRTFQNIKLFSHMTVFDNVMVGQHCQSHSEWFSSIFRLGRMRREEELLGRRAQELICFFGLEDVKNTPAGELPYGTQRRVELARAIAAKPKLLLLDEPTAGMNSNESTEIMKLILRIRDQGTTILLVEHDMHVAMSISDRITVLDMGVKIAEGLPGEIQQNKTVIEAYLGSGA